MFSKLWEEILDDLNARLSPRYGWIREIETPLEEYRGDSDQPPYGPVHFDSSEQLIVTLAVVFWANVLSGVILNWFEVRAGSSVNRNTLERVKGELLGWMNRVYGPPTGTVIGDEEQRTLGAIRERLRRLKNPSERAGMLARCAEELKTVLTRHGWPSDELASNDANQLALAIAERVVNYEQSGSSGRVGVTISWSGTMSRKIAVVLSKWLEETVDGVEAWISESDIAIGTPWFEELMMQLERSRVVVICVTAENVTSPWVHFEAGAIARRQEHSRVCPYLIGVDPDDLRSGPLVLFQCARSDKEGTLKLIRGINGALGDARNSERVLLGLFRSQWPKLKRRLDTILGG